ncbi:PIG-L deacetylase family protein [Sphingosinicella sp. BN140058]|uniref:PIG-L deacetylase family protein n=1 Tax=Sphingosinicella sp. BN140058 TaxID=1892855 RepID=UPI0010119789|nr:PIG-L deacetylase family protein [Sphingosinicella sp. BN140058]QAY78042.1 PIG-L family deacetylase [Sphingosinicella sp. BN140058]
MNALDGWRRIAIVAPHPDDEVLGCGGTMARLAKAGAEVHVVIVTKGYSPRFPEEMVSTVRDEARRAHEALGVARTHHLDLPAAELDQVPISDLNGQLGETLGEIGPDTLLVPFIGDIHVDHQLVFNAALVWARPRGPSAPARVLAYETLSETNWWAPGITPPFTPNCFVDITAELEAKLAAFSQFRSQLKAYPDERSLEAIRALAMMRGAAVYRAAAEAYVLIRGIC